MKNIMVATVIFLYKPDQQFFGGLVWLKFVSFIKLYEDLYVCIDFTWF